MQPQRIFFALALVVLGFSAGGFIAVRMVPAGSMGWDGIAAALGGSVTGAVTGLFMAVLVSGKLSARSALVAGLAAVGAAIMLLTLRFVLPSV
ncbi:MAG TPA: hypothetical protein PL096_04350 [Micropepsaceae bacterium]|nr:hypothetical protein [Micropepsaceae bacterium]